MFPKRNIEKVLSSKMAIVISDLSNQPMAKGQQPTAKKLFSLHSKFEKINECKGLALKVPHAKGRKPKAKKLFTFHFSLFT